MTKLLCEPEDRLGANPSVKPSMLSVRSGVSSIFPGLGSDGAEQIKAHPWFQAIEWESKHGSTVDLRKHLPNRSQALHTASPPYHPDLQADDDTRHFDDDIPNEVCPWVLQSTNAHILSRWLLPMALRETL